MPTAISCCWRRRVRFVSSTELGRLASTFKVNADTADAADFADCFWREQLPSAQAEAVVFCPVRGEFAAPETIRRIRYIRSIRIPFERRWQ